MIHALAAALAYFTRLPLPQKMQLNEIDFVRGSCLFPWIGLLVGLFQAAVIFFLYSIVPAPIAVFISVVSIIWFTGGLHEDGLADCADAFGGGFNDRQRILQLMKDPRLGTYGGLALIMMFLWRLQTTVHIPMSQIWMVLPLIHGSSRLLALCLAWSLPYARSTEASTHAKQFIRYSHSQAIIAISSILLFPFLVESIFFLSASLCLLALFLALRIFLWRRLQGFTGDCLGAAQQIAEASLYAVWIIIYVQN